MHGKINGIEVIFTIDTGATATIVSTKVFQSIPLDKRPTLQMSTLKRLVNADGRPIEFKGRAHLALQLGSVPIEKTVTIADIEDEVLLGADLLFKDPSGPADLILSEDRMLFR